MAAASQIQMYKIFSSVAIREWFHYIFLQTVQLFGQNVLANKLFQAFPPTNVIPRNPHTDNPKVST